MNYSQTSKKRINLIFSLSLLGFLITFCSNFIFAQPYFENHFGSLGLDVSRSIIQSQSGNIYIAGYQDSAQSGNINFLLTKCNKNGNILFKKNFGDSLADNCFSVLEYSESKILIAGETYTSNTNFDGMVYCLDTLGNIVWQLQIGQLLINESIKSIAKTSDGNILAAGFISDSSNSNDFWVVKISPNGNIIWQKTFGDDKNNTAVACLELSNGNYAIVGDAQSHNNDYDVMVVVTDTSGTQIWQNRFGDSFQNGSQGVFESTDHNLIFFGETEISAASPFDFFVQKINFNGNSIWRKTFGGAKSDAIFSGLEIADGFIFTGYSNSYNSGPLNLVALKTDTAVSQIEWINNFGGGGVDIGYKIIKSNTDIGFYIVGIYDDFGNTQNYLIHINNNGYATQNEIIKNSAITIYPNPAKDYVCLTPNNLVQELSIYNSIGELVLFAFNTQNEINLNNLKKGVYFVKAKTLDSVDVKKLIIE